MVRQPCQNVNGGEVLDEAQLVSNYNTIRSEIARTINTSARWLVSGTPMNNTIEDLHGLLSCLGSSEKSAGDIWRDKKTYKMKF